MILYEFEGKQLLASSEIAVPKSVVLNSTTDTLPLNFPVVVKAQVLSGKRADAGGILFADTLQGALESVNNLLNKTINQEQVKIVLVEEKIQFEKEYYLSLTYDTQTRGPVLTFTESGGTGVEGREVKKISLDTLNPTQSVELSNLPIDKTLLEKIIQLFFDADCLLLEINPLVKTLDGKFVALDAKVKLDDTALKRHTDWQFPPRAVPGYQPTEREIAAKKIDEDDYRGTAGSAYFDFDGDIAVLASGGGASLTAMDELLKAGGRAANYTEYSGNPPKEKVERLTQIVLSKPNLHGLWVVGAIANFTDIYETLSGLIDGLRKAQEHLNTKFDFPIVIRRGGPRDKEAFEMLRKVKDFDLHLYGEETSITKSAGIMADLAKEYADKGDK